MNHRITGLSLLLLSWLTLHGTSFGADTLSEIQRRGTLVWGADQEGGGPFVFPDDEQPAVLRGFEVDLAEYLAKQLNVRAVFHQGQWDKLPDLLDRGDIDLVLNGYEWSPQRAARYGTTIPYYIYELQLLGRVRESPFQNWDDLRTTINPKTKIAVLGGSAAQDYLEQHYPESVEPVLFDGASDAMRAAELNAAGIAANLQDLPVWTFYQTGFPGLHAVGPPVGRGYYVGLVRADDQELLQAINQAILQGLTDGTLRRIFAKYGLWNATQAARGLELNSEGDFVGDQNFAAAVAEESSNGTQSYHAVSGWRVLYQRGGPLLVAAVVTILLSVCAMPLAVGVGLIMALLRRYGPRWSAPIATTYVELVRGTPLVLQLYVIFFLLPELGISLPPFFAAVLGLAINYSAYEAEIYRAGLQAVPAGQMEAALSLGMSRWLAVRRIIVPQATRLVIPPVTNDFIALFKDTAVCSVITVVELSKEYYIQARSTGAIVELGILTAILYLAMSYPLSLVAGYWERRLQGARTA